MTITWQTLVYVVAAWGAFDLLVRVAYRVPPWAGLDSLFAYWRRPRVHVIEQSAVAVQYQELLASIWLYVNWRYVTKQLTTEEKELWADAIDLERSRMYVKDGDDEPWDPIERWWR